MRVEQLQLPYLSIFEGLLQQDARTRAIEMLGYMVKSEYLIKNEIFSDISGSSRAQSSHGTINQSIQADNLGGLFDFSWGPRAFVEYDYFDLAHFIGEVLDTDPDSNFLLRISRVSGKSITEEQPGESLDQTQEQQPV
ncbi:hypothetical protein AX774_g2968 [Zancudomyces culisetae]|uniref:Uncharacterized protein n=1 Tax=Zancudomyces culisetae TaxID=1213189 RepID=A0A1R1PRE5_ZANCU|nr:hypothetical protein AX774_g2968 [Zancudomyces culisetae]|eukprot:OMH83527.1 hypothetical protein AX774_g2968 [Zancudomyces culisetae]